MSELNLNTIGYDYDRVKEQVGAGPVNPFFTILIYVGISLIFSTMCVISYYLCEYDGDWNKVFEDDDLENN